MGDARMNVQDTLTTIVERLKPVAGINALVLGGSRARGNETPGSDIDIGIYYDAEKGLDIAALRQAAAELDDDRRVNVVTEPGEWGPWINGGGWLKVNEMPVDLLFREQNKVAHVIEECSLGRIAMDYQPGHPHGFASSIYLAEVALCQALWDPSGIVTRLKSKATPYPPAFQKATIEKFWWEAAFALDHGYKGIGKNDLAYIAGCLFRCAACLNQVLFAMNEVFLMNEKGAAAVVDSFPKAPGKYSARINSIFSSITEDRELLKKAFGLMRELIQETESFMAAGLTAGKTE